MRDERKDPEDVAREYVATCRQWAERAGTLCECEIRSANGTRAVSSARLQIWRVQIQTFSIITWRCGLLLILAALAVGLSGCTGSRPLKGGQAQMRGPVAQAVVQGDNPAGATRQGQETIRIRSYTVPAGSRVEQAQVQISAMGVPVTNMQSVVVSAPTPVTEREETRANTELGAAQKDTARELTAKLSSLKGIVWVGVALFIFGIASLFWPPLKAIIGSVTTSTAITVGGLALIILPTLIVGNELLILGGVVLVVGGWFLAHRHGQLRGTLTSLITPASPSPRPANAERGEGLVSK